MSKKLNERQTKRLEELIHFCRTTAVHYFGGPENKKEWNMILRFVKKIETHKNSVTGP